MVRNLTTLELLDKVDGEFGPDARLRKMYKAGVRDTLDTGMYVSLDVMNLIRENNPQFYNKIAVHFDITPGELRNSYVKLILEKED